MRKEDLLLFLLPPILIFLAPTLTYAHGNGDGHIPPNQIKATMSLSEFALMAVPFTGGLIGSVIYILKRVH